MATRTISDVGGNWNVTGTWVEGAVPNSSDDVVATATSGPLTMNVAGTARSLDFTNYSNTYTLTNNVTLGTSSARGDLVMLKLSPTMAVSGTASINCAGSYAANFVTIDTGGKTLPCDMAFNTNGKWRFISDATARNLSHTSGTLDLNSRAFTLNQLTSSGSVARTIIAGSAVATLTTTGTTVALQLTQSNLTMNAPDLTVNIAGNNGIVVQPSGIVLGTINLTGTGTQGIYGSVTCTNLTRTGTATPNARLWLGWDTTLTVLGTFTVTDFSGSRIWLGPASSSLATKPDIGKQATVALGTTGTASLSGVDITDVSFTGTNTPVAGTRVGNAQGNSGITFDAPRTLYWVGGVGNWEDPAHWATSSGGSGGASIPLPQDDVIVDGSSFTANSQNITCTCDRLCRDFTFSPTRTGCSYGATGDFSIFGSAAVTSGSAATNTSLTFRGRGNHTLNQVASGNWIWRSNCTFAAPGGTYTLVATAFAVGTVSLLAGTLAMSSFALDIGGSGTFDSSIGTVTRVLDLGSGMLAANLTITLGTVASGFTITGTGTLRHSCNGTRNATFGGQTIPNFTSAPYASSTSTFQDALTVAGTLSATGGINTNGKAVTCGSFISPGTLTRTLAFGASPITVNGDLVFSGTGLTLTPGTSTVTVNGQTGNTVVAGNGLAFNSLTLVPKTDAGSRMTVDVAGLSAATFTVSANNAVHGAIVLNGPVTTTTSFVATGQAGNPVYIYGPDWGGQATVASPTPTLSDVAFNRINATGGSWTGTGVTFIDNAWKQAVVIAG
jgi:hypothetical protein